MATTLFISYAHRDESYQQEVIGALQPLVERGLLDVWHDRRMVAGDDIFPNIAAALERARIVVLLVSEAFLGSEECAREMWCALEKRRKRRTVVVPVILRRCDWRGAPFGKLNALPVDGRPLDLAED
ncbi:MAG TPA: toll/interleukin-1 receptor domain-containing protein, partial [Tahibacter sp.]|nr:toll/interleukin-1 receptor domain-containing protein [Tahibacter sp.]